MLREALTLVLLTAATPAEPKPLPEGVQAVEIAEGTAYLLLPADGGQETRLTLLPEGVFFTRPGYTTLETATLGFQDDLSALKAKVTAYESAAIAPCPPAPIMDAGWGPGTVVVVVAALLVGGVVGYKVAK